MKVSHSVEMMQHALSPGRLLDKLVILWLMPPLGFLTTILQLPELKYLNSQHVLTAVLLAAIAIRWQFQMQARRAVLYQLLVFLLTAAFVSIEWLHFLAGKETIDNLTDLRMIIYSSLYGSIVIFALYAIYLTMLTSDQKRRHLGFFVRLMCWFHLFFLGYWFLLNVGWVEAIPKADLLHANSVAYGALFVLGIMYFYRTSTGLGNAALCAFLVINVAVILANQTRGAIIALVAVALYLFLQAMGNCRRTTLTKLMLAALFGLVLVFALVDGALVTRVLGRDAGTLGTVLDQIADAYEHKTSFVGVALALVSDENSISAFSRIGSNYYSLLSFLDNPMFGIGQTGAYSIKVLGAGVHSLHFLTANATGVVGLILFSALLVAIMSVQGAVILSRRLVIMLVLFFGYVLIFINSMPVYFAIILVVLAGERQQRQVKPLRGGGFGEDGCSDHIEVVLDK